MSTAIQQAGLSLLPSQIRQNSAIYHNVWVHHPEFEIIDDGGDNTFIARLRAKKNGVLVSGFGHLSDDRQYFRKVVLNFEPLQAAH